MRRNLGLRFAHVNIEVSDLSRSETYYDRFLLPLGLVRVRTTSDRWLGYRGAGVTLWLTESRPRRLARRRPRSPKTEEDDPISEHLAFAVRSGEEVIAVELRLRRRGFRPIYPVEWQPAQGGRWYVSTAWSDPDRVVIEIYATPRRRTGPPQRGQDMGRPKPART